jgi:drug/metabolite transporter (DMT)-like permease
VGFVVWGYAVARLAVTTATAALYLAPAVALLVAYLWLGERPALAALLGGALSVGGVLLINRRGAVAPRIPEKRLEKI